MPRQFGGPTYLESLAADRPLPETTYPHCDWRVLHSPGTCEFCDWHADWQLVRMAAGILFTDDPRNAPIIDGYLRTGAYSGGERPCPGMLARGEAITVWGGNRARPSAG